MLLFSKKVDSDIKGAVATGFSDQAYDYDKYAFVQRQAATHMIGMFEDIIVDLESPYIELGAGTGFVTQQVVKLLSEGELFVTDISNEMLLLCQKNLDLPSTLNVQFQQMDAENSLSPSKYGLILTALTAQWFSNTEDVLKGLLEGLKPGGVLMYSYLDERCFPEWKALCAETGILYTGNELPSAAPLRIDANKYCWEYSSSDLFSETYESPADFFKNLKRIGAGTQTSRNKSNYGAVIALNEHWQLKHKASFTITYGITFGAIRRKI